MSQQVTINSVTANTPVEIYYCDSMSASCVYVATVSVFPYTFDVPSPYDGEDIVIKIIDTQSCVDGQIIYITPTATPQPTVTPTQTTTTTPTNTPTTTNTPSITPTNTSTPTYTPTKTMTPSPTSTIGSTPPVTPTMTSTPTTLTACLHPSLMAMAMCRNSQRPNCLRLTQSFITASCCSYPAVSNSQMCP